MLATAAELGRATGAEAAGVGTGAVCVEGAAAGVAPVWPPRFNALPPRSNMKHKALSQDTHTSQLRTAKAKCKRTEDRGPETSE